MSHAFQATTLRAEIAEFFVTMFLFGLYISILTSYEGFARLTASGRRMLAEKALPLRS